MCHSHGIDTENSICTGMECDAILIVIDSDCCKALEIIDEILVRDIKSSILPFTATLTNDILTQMKQRNCRLMLYRGMDNDNLCKCIKKIIYWGQLTSC